jgi:hypothetical protein
MDYASADEEEFVSWTPPSALMESFVAWTPHNNDREDIVSWTPCGHDSYMHRTNEGTPSREKKGAPKLLSSSSSTTKGI